MFGSMVTRMTLHLPGNRMTARRLFAEFGFGRIQWSKIPVIFDLERCRIAFQRAGRGVEGKIFLDRFFAAAIVRVQVNFDALGEGREKLVHFFLLDIETAQTRIGLAARMIGFLSFLRRTVSPRGNAQS